MMLSEEQLDIIKTEGNIVVSAGAGAGKTKTLVEKIKYDIKNNSIKTHKILAAFTFTIKATNEIINRLASVNKDDIYVTTNNQFVINEIIRPFCKDCYGKEFAKEFNTSYNLKKNSFQECLEEMKVTGKICSLTDSKENFVFQLALKILKKSKIAKEYLVSKYYKWYIDEYQDSDNDMHSFFMYANNTLGIKMFIVGDDKQNIYSWRGANSNNFKELFDNSKFIFKKLTANFRSEQQIQNLSNLLNEETMPLIKPLESNNDRVILTNDYEEFSKKIENLLKIIKYYNEKTAILCGKNETAKSICKELNEQGAKFVYVPQIELDSIVSSYAWFYYGIAHFCLVNQNIYDFIEYIPNEIFDKDDELFEKIGGLLSKINKYKNTNNCNSYIVELATIFSCELENDDIEKLIKTINDNDNRLAFLNNDKENQCMTIHKSKGKEFDLVIILENGIFLSNNDRQNPQKYADFLNKWYVAITRAKQHLIVLLDNNSDCIKIIRDKISSSKLQAEDFMYFFETIII